MLALSQNRMSAVLCAAAEAPTAHQRILEEARRALTSREAEKRLLVVPPAAPRSNIRARGQQQLATNTSTDRVAADESHTRLQLCSREDWEREVCCHYANVELLYCVLKPSVDALLSQERQHRADLRLEEAGEFRAMTSSSNPAVVVFTSAKSVGRRQARRHQEESNTPASRPASAPDEAELILEKYRMQHEQRLASANAALREPATPVHCTAGATAAVPLRPAPPRRFLANAAPNNCLDLATAVHLHNQWLYFRRGIEDAEAETRVELVEQHKSEVVLVDALVRKRQHLERLVYWRAEREARQAVEDRLATIRQLIVAVELEEEKIRFDIDADCSRDDAELWTQEFTSFCLAQVADLHNEEALHRSAVLTQHDAATAMEVLPFAEGLSRNVILGREQCECARDLVWAHNNLRHLETYWRNVRAQVVAIQRFYRKRRLGLVGWRRTHRDVGDWVLHHRSSKRQRQSRLELTNYRAAVDREVQKALDEIEQELVSEQQSLHTLERRARLEVATQEGWFRAGMQRRMQTNLIHDIIMPMLHSIAQEETRLRDTLEIFVEAPARDALHKWHSTLMVLMHSKVATQKSEGLDRFALTDAELEDWEDVCLDSRRSVEKVRERQQAHEAAQDCERAAMVALAEADAERHVVAEFFKGFRDIMFRFKLEMVCVIAFSSRLSGRQMLGCDESSEYVMHCENFLEWSHAFHGRRLLTEVKLEVNAFTRYQMLLNAQVDKELLLKDAVTDLTGPICSMFTDEHHVIEVRVERRHRAACVIQTFFRAYERGMTGRSGMRNYLRLRFEEKRARADIRRKMEEQRNDCAAARKELDDEIAKHNAITEQEYQELCNYIASKVEPRQRNNIAAQQVFIVNIIKRNFDLIKIDIVKDNLSELVQREGYFRTAIYLEWKASHDALIRPRQLVFVSDVKIRPAQRAWRCFRARRERQTRADTLVYRLPTIECRERCQIELEALHEWAIEVDKPHVTFVTYFTSYFSGTLLGADGIAHGAFGAPLAILVTEEWQERCGIFWTLQQTLRYRLVEDTEGRERRLLTTSTLDAGRRRAELLEVESANRMALYNERALFLLRLLSAMESSARRLTYGVCLESHRDVMCAIVEPFDRALVDVENVHDWLWLTMNCESQRRLLARREEDNARKQLQMAAAEDAARIDVADTRHSLINWFLWLCGVQEFRQRVEHIQRDEARERHFALLVFSETVSRWNVCREWQLKMSHPSVFSPRGVLSHSPPYLYCCEHQEELQRRMLVRDGVTEFWSKMQTLKTSTLGHYINASARTSTT